LLPFIVAPAALPGPALPAHRINLVNKNYGWSLLPGLLEQIAHPGRADADEHFDKLGTGDAEERRAGLTGHDLGQQGLSSAI
jgi:hypothetical protein